MEKAGVWKTISAAEENSITLLDMKRLAGMDKVASNTRAFTTIEEVLDAGEQWNDLVRRQSENPFLLIGFVQRFFQSSVRKSQKPLFLVHSVGQRVVGIAPFTINSWKGILRVASFLLSPDYSPDFIVQEEYRKDFLHGAIDFLFNNVGCNLLDISLPSKSASLQVLRMAGEELGIYHMTRPAAGHTVLSVDKSWTEFERERGRNFRRFFRKVERKMDLAGPWKTAISTRDDCETEIYKDIVEIEEYSWKQGYRAQRGLEIDQNLLDLWAGATYSSTEAEFKWRVAFLEVNAKKIAYSLWLEYKDVGFICKTSFDRRYGRYYPGIFINNLVVRELFNNPRIRQIDFMTDLPFHDRWMSESRPRFGLTMSKSPVLMLAAKGLNSPRLMGARRTVGRVTSRVATLPF